MSTSKTDPHVQVLEAARSGDLNEVKYWVGKGGSIHMAVMGAGDVMEGNVMVGDEIEGSTSTAKQIELVDGAKAVGKWAMDNGACFLWSFSQQPKRSKFSVLKYNKNVSMLKGPGVPTPMTRNGLLDSTNSPCRLLFENVLENIKMR